jgi:hypothetical protein
MPSSSRGLRFTWWRPSPAELMRSRGCANNRYGSRTDGNERLHQGQQTKPSLCVHHVCFSGFASVTRSLVQMAGTLFSGSVQNSWRGMRAHSRSRRGERMRR